MLPSYLWLKLRTERFGSKPREEYSQDNMRKPTIKDIYKIVDVVVEIG